MRLADRYLLCHLPLPFAVGLAVFVCIMLAEIAWHISGLLVGTGVSGLALLEFFAYSAPRAVVWSTPVGLVVAVCFAMTNLARHGEITALRAGGMSLARLQLPWFAAAAVASGVAVWANQWLVPRTTQRAYELFSRMTLQAPVAKEAWQQFFRSPQGDLFYVRRMNASTGRLEGITIWRVDGREQVRRLLVARSAQVEGSQWVLREGYQRDFDATGRPLGAPLYFHRLPISMWEAIHQYYADNRTPYEMSITELRALARVLEAGGKDPHRLLVHLHFAYSIPCAGLVFVLVAGPLAYRYAHLGNFAGLVLAIAIVFLYNGLRSWTLALGLAGTLSPALAGWLPNATFALAGLVMLARER
jgi:lipopolysaccharide export system permease protein